MSRQPLLMIRSPMQGMQMRRLVVRFKMLAWALLFKLQALMAKLPLPHLLTVVWHMLPTFLELRMNDIRKFFR